jgi:hypothetical protein
MAPSMVPWSYPCPASDFVNLVRGDNDE